MNNEKIYEELKIIFEENGLNIESYSIEEIDSITYISIILDIEEKMNINFGADYLETNILSNLDVLIEYIKRNSNMI